MSEIKPLLVKVAKETRSWAEVQARILGFPSDLCGMCAKASAELWRRLKAAGVAAEIHLSNHHAFVVAEGYIIDVTISQFTKNISYGRDIAVEPVKDSELTKYFFYEGIGIYLSDEELRNGQIKRNWQADQVA